MTDTQLTSAERRVQADIVEAKPHRWGLSLPARLYRRALRRWDVDKHIRAYCRPLMVEGKDNLGEATNPMLIIANHTSHFDTVIILGALPRKVWDRTAVVAAADRMYRDKRKGMMHSLRYNAFPITRGGGREALAYSQWLLHNNWSLLIFPEGARSRDGEMLPFRGGPAILALGQHVPILPMHIHGANNILPPGEKYSRPAPVQVSIGRPFVLEDGTTIPEAKARMEAEVRALKPAS